MEPETKDRGVVNVPPALMRAYAEAAASAGQRPTAPVVAFITWWMGTGTAPMRPEWQADITNWSGRTSLSFFLSEGEWDRFGALAAQNGYTRAELVEWFMRWFIGRAPLPFPAAQQVGNNPQK